MQTEFTCGSYKAFKNGTVWDLTVNRNVIAHIHPDGSLMQSNPECNPLLSIDDLIEIVVLMNNIKRQYKQHENTCHP